MSRGEAAASVNAIVVDVIVGVDNNHALRVAFSSPFASNFCPLFLVFFLQEQKGQGYLKNEQWE